METTSKNGRLRFVWLEITGRCQLECAHCYADSGPRGGHGSMTVAHWRRIIGEASALGCEMVQFIGGEPTLHPAFHVLVEEALAAGLEVEVFSNLVHVRSELWRLFEQPGVSLATSYYSDHGTEHDRITTRPGSHARTRANIAETSRRSIPLRVGIIDIEAGQRVDHARQDLEALGVTEIGMDRLRQVGRGTRGGRPDVSQLCGDCGKGKVAVGPDGTVWPCVFSRWLPVGNVRHAPLRSILDGPAMAAADAELATHVPPTPTACRPDTMCDPQCGPSCSPACNPVGNCRPAGGCAPDHR